MNINYYIKQVLLFKEILEEWKSSLSKMHAELQDSSKKGITVYELKDKKKLLHCEKLTEYGNFPEIDEIHKLFSEEKNMYSLFVNLVSKPLNLGLFESKSAAKKKRDTTILKYLDILTAKNEDEIRLINTLFSNLTYFSSEEFNTPSSNENTTIDNKSEKKVEISVLKEYASDIDTERIKGAEKQEVKIKDEFNYDDEIRKILGF